MAKHITNLLMAKATKKVNLGLANYLCSRFYGDKSKTFENAIRNCIKDNMIFDEKQFKYRATLDYDCPEKISLEIWLAEAMLIIDPERVDKKSLAGFKKEAQERGLLIPSKG